MSQIFFKIGDFLTGVFLLVPYPGGIKAIIAVLFLVLCILPFFLPKEYIYLGAEDKKPWRDLRVWAAVVALSELAVYLYF